MSRIGRLPITIPAGVSNGQKIRIQGQGGAAPQGGTRGDLYITFLVSDDPQFTRKGDELYTTATVDIFTLMLGGEVIVTTLDGSVRIHIKSGTQPDSKLRVRGKGMPHYKKEEIRGDLIVTIKAYIPSLNKEQEKLLQECKKKGR